MGERAGGEIQQEVDALKDAFFGKENQNFEIQKVTDTTCRNETQIERLVKDITTMFESSKRPSPNCRIRVPDYLRKVNEKAYTPKFISIGPIHHSDVKLQTMKKCKVMYLENFIKNSKVNLKTLVSATSEMEESIRCCYAENISSSMHSDDFVKLILVDAIFILELFLIKYSRRRPTDDPMTAEQWMLTTVRHDLVLLENQLPFFVLEKLFNLSFPGDSNFHSLVGFKVSLIKLTFDFFKSYNVRSIDPNNFNVKIEHFTDLIRTFHLCSSSPRSRLKLDKPLYSATQLHEAGVKFKKGSTTCFLDIKFDLKNGVLEMPCFKLYDETVAQIRNLIALEQSRYLKDTRITDYFGVLDFLINTTQDMDLLCEKGILVNYQGDNKAATSIVNSLNTHVIFYGMNDNYHEICKDLNEFYETPWHKWKATLKHEYFSTPWRSTSTIAAIILLILTFIQTVCSIIQVA